LRAFERHKHKLFAAALGVLVAAGSAYGFTSWLTRQGEAEASVVADWSIGFFDQTIGGVVADLNRLAARDLDSCSTSDIETLRQAVFASGPVKELAVVAPSGETMCTDLGSAFAPRDVLASAATSNRNIMLDVVRFVGRNDRLLRVRLLAPERKPALAALVPIQLLVPRLAPNGDPLPGHASLALPDGTILGASGDEIGTARQNDYVSARARSERYGAVTTVTMPRGGTVAGYDDLRRIGIVACLMLTLTILICAMFFSWRQRHNPVAEIRAALLADQFVPYYQPILDIKTGKILGAEVLVRWRRSDGTIVAPGAFISLLESNGFILDLTRSLMRKVSTEVGKVVGARPGMYITFNIAPRHFEHSMVLNDVGAIFEGSPVSLSQIVLEITERFEIENLTATRRVIAALQGLGCRVALDDVGCGHNGLSYILKLGVDIIKIDRLFVEAIEVEHQAQAIVETLVSLARNLRMQIVAEGVERIDQVEYLREHGISAAQGYLFAPPLPGSAFIKLVNAMHPLTARSDGKDAAATSKGTTAAHLAAA
jgi:sensor c-di-GMP phosphodiesterase-like protein